MISAIFFIFEANSNAFTKIHFVDFTKIVLGVVGFKPICENFQY